MASLHSKQRRQKSLTYLGLVIGFGLVSASIACGQSAAEHAALRKKMVDLYVRGAGVKNERVLTSMESTPRHEFMPRDVQSKAYLDAGIPIGEAQTISSPFIVAYMTESLDPQPDDKVLEIGTGSGYQAAVLSPLVREVYTIEIVEPLGLRAERTLKRLKYGNVHVKIGDGFLGWPQHAPFDKIIVTCSPESVPQPLVDQLAEGGLMIIPVGERHQQTLTLMRKKQGELETEALQPTLFVPMTGQAESDRHVLPDATKPTLLNGDFEESLPENGHVPGWYYQRQIEVVQDQLAPNGLHFVQFENSEPLAPAHLMQGFSIDGTQVKRLKYSGAVRCDNVRPTEFNDLPMIAITFYDEDRRDLGTTYLGPFRGTMGWQHFQREERVPEKAREAILRIGLFGAVGRAGFDDLRIERVDK